MGDDSTGDPQRVVILGGGPSGVATAYWLSAPEQNGKYKVSLYTQGWRLGGKCASGRDFDPGMGARIEEHGLHVLMGCYQNGFATLRNCYAAWREAKPDPDNYFQIWTDAFLPLSDITLMAQDGPGDPPTWSPWRMPDPPAWPGFPGDGPLAPGAASDAPTRADIGAFLQTMAALIKAQTPKSAPYAASLNNAFDRLDEAIRSGNVTDAANVALKALRGAQDEVGAYLAAGASPTPADDIVQFLWRLALLAGLGLAIGAGWVKDIMLQGPGAYDALDTQDFLAWLAANGAGPAVVASAPANALYDLGFARGGTAAAGAALRAQLEMAFGFRHAPLWRMASGMGDTVFTPFYDVLMARGVEINFFHRVTGLAPSADGARIDSVQISVQAATADGEPYAPLVRVDLADGKHLDCWPNQPLWDQLADGAALKAQGVDFELSSCLTSVGPPLCLNAGADFDIAVVAMPPPCLSTILAANRNAAWTTALSESRCTPTQSLQLWMRPTLDELGWQGGSTVLTTFAEPYDSWGDMSQVIPTETWSGLNVPRSIGYFCGVMDNKDATRPISKGMMDSIATSRADAWMTANLAFLWPQSLVSPALEPPILSRYSTANYDGSDLYVLTPAGGNVASRFDPGAPAGYANLYTVGDWTRTRFSGGCFESAIESAMLASRAISGFPQWVFTG